MSQFDETNAKNSSAKIFRKSVLLSNFTLKHSKIAELPSFFFSCKSKTLTIRLSLEFFVWANSIEVSEDIFFQFCLDWFFLSHNNLFHGSFSFSQSLGFSCSTCTVLSYFDMIDTNRIFSSYSNFRQIIRYRSDTISYFPNPA